MKTVQRKEGINYVTPSKGLPYKTREGRRRDFRNEILPVLEKLYAVNEFAPNSFRIKGDSFTIDYYSPNYRLFNHIDKEWYGGIDNPFDFIEQFFGLKEVKK